MFFLLYQLNLFHINCILIFIHHRDLSNEVSCASNGDNMTKLQPQGVGCQTNSNEAINSWCCISLA